MPPQGKPVGAFRTAQLAGDMKVEFLLDLKDDEGDHTIRCYVDEATLANSMGLISDDELPHDDDEILDLYDIIQDRIHNVVNGKLKLGQFEDDGSIVVWKHDLPDRRRSHR